MCFICSFDGHCRIVFFSELIPTMVQMNYLVQRINPNLTESFPQNVPERQDLGTLFIDNATHPYFLFLPIFDAIIAYTLH